MESKLGSSERFHRAYTLLQEREAGKRADAFDPVWCALLSSPVVTRSPPTKDSTLSVALNSWSEAAPSRSPQPAPDVALSRPLTCDAAVEAVPVPEKTHLKGRRGAGAFSRNIKSAENPPEPPHSGNVSSNVPTTAPQQRMLTRMMKEISALRQQTALTMSEVWRLRSERVETCDVRPAESNGAKAKEPQAQKAIPSVAKSHNEASKSPKQPSNVPKDANRKQPPRGQPMKRPPDRPKSAKPALPDAARGIVSARKQAPAPALSPQNRSTYSVKDYSYTSAKLREHMHRHHEMARDAKERRSTSVDGRSRGCAPNAAQISRTPHTAEKKSDIPRSNPPPRATPPEPLRTPKVISAAPAPIPFVSPRQEHVDAEPEQVSPLSDSENESPAKTFPSLRKLPLLQLLAEINVSDPGTVRATLLEMLQSRTLRDCLVLTSLTNVYCVLESVIAPLLVNELSAVPATRDDPRRSQLLCAIAGLGPAASVAFDVLMEMLQSGAGDRKLVCLALRCVGGARAVHALCRVVQTNPSARIRGTAAYALSLVGVEIAGKTVAVCIDSPQFRGKIAFYQPETTSTNHVQRGVPSMMALKAPEYRVTHVVLDADVVARHVLQLLHSPRYKPAQPYPWHASVLRDFFDTVKAVRPKAGFSEALLKEVPGLEDEAAVALSASKETRFLAGVIEEVKENPRLRELITTTLLQQLLSDNDDVVAEQILMTLTALPEDLVSGLLPQLQSFAQQTIQQSRSQQLVVVSLLCLGRIAGFCHQKRREDKNVIAVVDVLGSALESAAWKERQAACVALGSVGPAAERFVPVIVRQMERRAILAASAARTLGCCGENGILQLSAVLQQQQLPSELRAEVAKGIAELHLPLGKETTAAWIDTLAAGLSSVITQERHVLNKETLVVECIAALGALLAPLTEKRLPTDFSEPLSVGGSSRDEGPLVQLLLPVIENGDTSRTIQLSAADALGKYGGLHGEAALCRLAMNSVSPNVRSAAIVALRHQRGSPIRPLALALLDQSDIVRAAALDTLQSIGAQDLLEAIRRRPPDQQQQLRALFNDFLTLHRPNELVRSLHEALSN